MKLNFRLPSFPTPSSLKTPATTDTENTRHQDTQDASSFYILPPANKKPQKFFPSLLQNAFGKRENQASPLPRIPFKPERHIAAAEQKAVENVMEYLSDNGKNGVLTSVQLKNKMKRILRDALQDIDTPFDHIIDQQNAIPGQSLARIQASKKQARTRLAQSVVDIFGSEGWIPHRPEDSNVQWELDRGPLLVKCGLSLQQLKLDKPFIAHGSFGSVSIFENENGDKLIGKISIRTEMDENGNIEDYLSADNGDRLTGKTTTSTESDENENVRDDLACELEAYKTIYEAVGPHPNLVNAYGIGQIPNSKGQLLRTLVMDMVPGPNGEKVFDTLGKCWDAGKISSEEYWSAIQFIGRRILDVTEHLGKAGVVHNDIKPENFLVNEETGEPVLIDLGEWSKTGTKGPSGARIFAAPETINKQEKDERSDVFTVGASLLDGIERDTSLEPNKGLARHDAVARDHEGNIVRKPGTYAAETAYTKFMEEVLKNNKGDRPNSNKAKKLDFLNDSMLDDDAAKEVIKKAISLARIEEGSQKQNSENP